MSDDEELARIVTGLARENLTQVFLYALVRMPLEDFTERAAWCRANGKAEPEFAVDGEDAVIVWGGRPLSYTPLRALMRPNLDMTFAAMPPVPDDISEIS